MVGSVSDPPSRRAAIVIATVAGLNCFGSMRFLHASKDGEHGGGLGPLRRIDVGECVANHGIAIDDVGGTQWQLVGVVAVVLFGVSQSLDQKVGLRIKFLAGKSLHQASHALTWIIILKKSFGGERKL